MTLKLFFRLLGANHCRRRSNNWSCSCCRHTALLLSIYIISCAFTSPANAQNTVLPPTYVLQHRSINHRPPHVVNSFQTDNSDSIRYSANSFRTHIDASKMVNITSTRPTIDEYLSQRTVVMAREHGTGFECDAPALNEREQLANVIVMAAKRAELDAGHADPQAFGPSQHFFDAMDQIRASKLFKIIRRMPKGGILHAHDTALASVDFLVSLTYRPDLWQCTDPLTGTIVGFRFARQAPAALATSNGTDTQWSRTADERLKRGADSFDRYVRTHFTLRTKNPNAAYKDINDVWKKFMSLFILVEPLVTYVPVWRDYYRQSLKEALEDNVQYVEFRGLLPPVYDLDGREYTKADIVQMYVDVLAEFKRENPTFIGSKFVYAPLKAVPNSTFEEYVTIIKQLQNRFPDFMAGFDLVGQEDTGRTLISFAELLLQLPEDIKFFFHAGETNWFGSIDENLVDAILLGSLRIGHGYALAKHPTLLQLVKERDIAIEINPLSNQILKLVSDMRNHPASIYFSQNVPLIVSSDDPCFWEATPLSDDFYQAFIGIASSHSDLRTLKKLATNSFRYSALSADEKTDAMAKWQIKWSAFVEEVIAEKV